MNALLAREQDRQKTKMVADADRLRYFVTEGRFLTGATREHLNVAASNVRDNVPELSFALWGVGQQEGSGRKVKRKLPVKKQSWKSTIVRKILR